MAGLFHYELERLTHGRLRLPVEVSEYDATSFRRRVLWICGLASLTIMALLFGAFLSMGFFPSIHGAGIVTERPAHFGRTLFIVIVVVPLAVGLLLLWIMRSTAPFSRNADGHPYRFRATEEGLTVAFADGREIAGPWSSVTLQAVQTIYFKPGVTPPVGLEFTVAGETIAIQIPRLRRPGRRMFLRALAQHWQRAAR